MNSPVANSERRTANDALRNHQFAAVRLFQLHGFIQRDDCALDLAVVRRLRRDPLQPQSRRRHQREQRAAMFGGEANDLVGNAAISGSSAIRMPNRDQKVCTGIAMYTSIEMIITVIRKLVPQRG
jgi:hypothetical protein